MADADDAPDDGGADHGGVATPVRLERDRSVRSPWVRRGLLALVAVAAVGAGVWWLIDAVGEEERAPDPAPPVEDADDQEATPPEEPPAAFHLATLLPETGPTAALAAPQLAGVTLALEEITAGGGVLGAEVIWTRTDTGGDADGAGEAAQEAVDAAATVVVGPASTRALVAALPTLEGADVVTCTPAVTSDGLAEAADGSRLVRTAPADRAGALAVAATLVERGDERVAVLAPDGPVGDEALAALEDALEDVLAVRYAAGDDGEEVVGQVPDDVDAVALLGAGEAVALLRVLLEGERDPATIVAGPGLFTPRLAGEDLDADALAEVTLVGPGGDVAFSERLAAQLAEDDLGDEWVHGAQAYDCAVLLALATAAAQLADPDVELDADGVHAQLGALTTDGPVCRSFAACLAALEAGTDVRYLGPAGPLAFDGIDPTGGRFTQATLDDDGTLTARGHVDVPVTWEPTDLD